MLFGGGDVREELLQQQNDRLEAEVEHLRAAVHECPTCGATCRECRCVDAELAGLRTEIERLTAIIEKKLRRRKCFHCEHVGYYADSILPYRVCEECGSEDTRRMEFDL